MGTNPRGLEQYRRVLLLAPHSNTVKATLALALHSAGGKYDLEAARLAVGNAMDRGVVEARHRLGLSAGRLNSLSPLAVLGRGYSLTRLPSGEIVRRADQVAAGAGVRVVLHEGSLDCRVEATWEHDERPQV